MTSPRVGRSGRLAGLVVIVLLLLQELLAQHSHDLIVELGRKLAIAGAMTWMLLLLLGLVVATTGGRQRRQVAHLLQPGDLRSLTAPVTAHAGGAHGLLLFLLDCELGGKLKTVSKFCVEQAAECSRTNDALCRRASSQAVRSMSTPGMRRDWSPDSPATDRVWAQAIYAVIERRLTLRQAAQAFGL
ncbi:hypothetical protein PF005_g27886 [Phytophthora fragariae]|uniref:HTH psq-type domain-containing protein n=1 Tax=Phytophthora fragariae TaxID=53985 RepID=A0A6A3VR47_9STRA|nr:hypothetical protein PF005_g27886 [Phytophthora fragariae]